MVVEPTIFRREYCLLDMQGNLLEVACASVRVTESADLVLASRVIDHGCLGCREVVRGRHLGARENDTERHDSSGGRQRQKRDNSPQEDLQWRATRPWRTTTGP